MVEEVNGASNDGGEVVCDGLDDGVDFDDCGSEIQFTLLQVAGADLDGTVRLSCFVDAVNHVLKSSRNGFLVLCLVCIGSL